MYKKSGPFVYSEVHLPEPFNYIAIYYENRTQFLEHAVQWLQFCFLHTKNKVYKYIEKHFPLKQEQIVHKTALGNHPGK